MEKLPLNRFLQSRAEVDNCSTFIKNNNLVPHAISCKDFDIACISPYLTDGNILDMGCIGSHILDNAARLNTQGLRYGIDLLFKPEDIDDSPGSWNNVDNPKVPGSKFFQGDLMHTPFDKEAFDIITCLSVIEHSVDYNALAQECSRLLKTGGRLYLTFDYWPDKVATSKTILYDLNWDILDERAVNLLLEVCAYNGLHISSPMDFTVNEAVINPSFCSPTNVSYTFGIIEFIKK